MHGRNSRQLYPYFPTQRQFWADGSFGGRNGKDALAFGDCGHAVGRASVRTLKSADLDPALQAGQEGTAPGTRATRPAAMSGRSEERTSELQSLMRSSDAVLCLYK